MINQIDHTIQSAQNSQINLSWASTIVNINDGLFLLYVQSSYLDHLDTKIKGIFRFSKSLLECLFETIFIRRRLYFINQ